MSEDQGRGRADAGHETDPAWLRHEFEQPDIRPHASPDDAWLRHDPSQRQDLHEAHDPHAVPSANGDHPAHPEDPADEPDPAARTESDPAARTESDPSVGSATSNRPDRQVHDDWDVYAAAAPSPADDEEEEGRRPAAQTGFVPVVKAATKEFVIVIGMALILSFVVKTWLLQAFYIPSGSMEDTLVLNDRVIVSKLTPGAFELKRGDIVVFADPGDWVDPLP
jgi:signal peptidase I